MQNLITFKSKVITSKFTMESQYNVEYSYDLISCPFVMTQKDQKV